MDSPPKKYGSARANRPNRDGNETETANNSGNVNLQNKVVMRDERLPWAKFYFGDHQNDPALRLCSLAARGLWVEMLAIMWTAEKRGFFVLNGNPISPVQLCRLVGVDPDEANGSLAELELNGVFSRDEVGVIYSRRMVRDHLYREQQRELGRLGGNPKLKAPVEVGVMAGDKAPLKPEQKQSRGRDRADTDSEKEQCVPISAHENEYQRPTLEALTVQAAELGIKAEIVSSFYWTCEAREYAADGRWQDKDGQPIMHVLPRLRAYADNWEQTEKRQRKRYKIPGNAFRPYPLAKHEK